MPQCHPPQASLLLMTASGAEICGVAGEAGPWQASTLPLRGLCLGTGWEQETKLLLLLFSDSAYYPIHYLSQQAFIIKAPKHNSKTK